MNIYTLILRRKLSKSPNHHGDKAGNVHVSIGKASFDAEKLQQNFQALIDTLIRVKPAAAKGQYIRSITVTSTMGPGVPVQLA